MLNNSYTIQYCSKCQQPLEKGRTQHAQRAVCGSCKKKRAKEYLIEKKRSRDEIYDEWRRVLTFWLKHPELPLEKIVKEYLKQ
jgi:hypothetical protein